MAPQRQRQAGGGLMATSPSLSTKATVHVRGGRGCPWDGKGLSRTQQKDSGNAWVHAGLWVQQAVP